MRADSPIWATSSQHPSGGDARARELQWAPAPGGEATGATMTTSRKERKVKVRGRSSGLAVAMATRTKPLLPLLGLIVWSSAPLLIVSPSGSEDAPLPAERLRGLWGGRGPFLLWDGAGGFGRVGGQWMGELPLHPTLLQVCSSLHSSMCIAGLSFSVCKTGT